MFQVLSMNQKFIHSHSFDLVKSEKVRSTRFLLSTIIKFHADNVNLYFFFFFTERKMSKVASVKFRTLRSLGTKTDSPFHAIFNKHDKASLFLLVINLPYVCEILHLASLPRNGKHLYGSL